MSDEHSVTFRFLHQQDVRILALNLPARVFARCDRGNGLREYRVIYWADGKRNDEWLFEYELTES